jgi:hypothetical protein
MKKSLTEKQLHTRLNNYYKAYYGERDTDEWYVNPAPNKWKLKRDGKIIILEYDEKMDKVIEH